ncbi:hypothetical protein GN956_G16031 [Arapaima gigas]
MFPTGLSQPPPGAAENRLSAREVSETQGHRIDDGTWQEGRGNRGLHLPPAAQSGGPTKAIKNAKSETERVVEPAALLPRRDLQGSRGSRDTQKLLAAPCRTPG